MKRYLRIAGILAAAMAGFRFLPGLAGVWQGHVALPLLQRLHRLTAALPFPALEPLALLFLCLCLHRRTRPAALAVVVGMYGLLWYPAYFAAPVESRDPAPKLETLCERLTDALNAPELAFEPPFNDAGEVAGLPWARVKPVRYPEWMRALHLSGLFSPWTGEALVDAEAPMEYLPFTCVHELQHLRGIADEGSANLAAYRACLEYGGMYADSARLWALRYAMARLDESARARVVRCMDDRLRALTAYAEPKGPSPLAALLGIDGQTRDYDAIVDWLMAVDFGNGKEYS